MKKIYYAHWGQAGKFDVANVSLEAKSFEIAQSQFNKIAKELSVTNTPRMITCEGKVLEIIDKGIS